MQDLIVFVTLLALGYFFGRVAESRHYRSIIEREKKYRNLLVIASKFPPAFKQPHQTTLVMGSVVVSVDYFKRFLASLRNIFGGRIRAYETLIDRARREAVLRMKEDAAARGGKMVFNIKMQTASISQGRRSSVGSVEVLAYGTVLIPVAQD